MATNERILFTRFAKHCTLHNLLTVTLWQKAGTPGGTVFCTHPPQERTLLRVGRVYTLRVSLCLCVHSTLPLRYVKKVLLANSTENTHTHTSTSTGCVQRAGLRSLSFSQVFRSRIERFASTIASHMSATARVL